MLTSALVLRVVCFKHAFKPTQNIAIISRPIKIFLALLDKAVLQPHSEKATTWPSPEPNSSGLHHAAYLFTIAFNIILSSECGSSKWFMPLCHTWICQPFCKCYIPLPSLPPCSKTIRLSLGEQIIDIFYLHHTPLERYCILRTILSRTALNVPRKVSPFLQATKALGRVEV
jgi:hypothetical protein